MIKKSAIMLLIILLVTCFIFIFTTPFWGDETSFHYPTTSNISISSIIGSNSNYDSAYTPLPYLLGSIICKINNSIYALRLFNYIIFLTLIFFLYKISLNFRDDPITFLLLLTCNPYLLKSSFTYNMTNYGLLFAIIGIYFYFFSQNKHKIILAHFFWGISVLCQQWMLIIVFSIFLHETILLIEKKLGKKYFIKGILFKFLFLLPSFILFLFWKGLTHPNFHHHEIMPSFAHLTGTLANFGIAGILILVFNFKKYNKAQYLLLVYLLPIFFLTVPAHSEGMGINVITGVASQLSMYIQKYLYLPYKLNMFFLATIGMMIIVVIISKKNNNFNSFLKYSILGFLAAFTCSELVGADHIFMALPFLFFAFESDLKEKKLLEISLVTFFFMMSLFYLIYYSLYKTQGYNL